MILADEMSRMDVRPQVAIFGTDIAPMAVWLCELRLWLSIVIDDHTTHPANIAPLPNLEHHIRIGDALGTDAFDATPALPSRRIASLRERYARSAGARKKIAAAHLDAAERTAAVQVTTHTLRTLHAERAQLLQVARARTLFGTRHGLNATQRRRLTTVRTLIRQSRRTLRRLDDGGATDFDFRTHFADAASAGGFDLVMTDSAKYFAEFWLFSSILHDLLGRVQLLGGDAGAKQPGILRRSGA